MKKRVPILNCMAVVSALLIMSWFVSCEKPENLTVSKNELSFTSAVKTISFKIVSDVAWTVIPTDSWITVSPASGQGDQTITVTVADNQTSSDRESLVTVKGSKKSVKVAVKQDGIAFSFDNQTGKMVFDENGTPQTLKIVSRFAWTLEFDSESAQWCEASPMSGSGDATVVFTPKPVTERKKRNSAFVTIKYSNTFSQLVVSQNIPNNLPTKPELTAPSLNETGVSVMPTFRWNASEDVDGDQITYSVMVSTNNTTWNSTTYSAKTFARFASMLSKNTTYYVKVVAKDDFDGKTESDVYTFQTGEGGGYKHGESRLYQENEVAGAKPVYIIVTGDGFTQDDYIDGGNFDDAADRAIEGFFGVEPYTSYRNYFKVYKLAAYSSERGATVKNDMNGASAQNRNTFFSSTLEGGSSTGISGDTEGVFGFVKKNVPVVTDSNIDDVHIIVIINLKVYAGTCWMYMSGRTVGYCPYENNVFEKVVTHECGGHGFGRLLDEYRYYDETLPQDKKDQVAYWRKNGYHSSDGEWAYGANLDFTGSSSMVHWKNYINNSAYKGYGGAGVGLFEGAYLYNYGSWRPEQRSCMVDNIPYFNAPSREAIVRRILYVAGKPFSQSDFIKNDKVKTYSAPATRAYEIYPPLAPPVLVWK